MASVFLPQLETDGIGAAILPGILTGKNKFALLVYFRDIESNVGMMNHVAALASRENGNLAHSFKSYGYSLAILEPGFVFSRRAWSGLGIRQHRLENPKNIIDLENNLVIRSRLNRVLSELNLKEDFFRPSVIGVNRYGEQVTSGPLGRSLVRKGVSHGEWELAPSGQLKGVVMGDAFFRGNTRKDFSGCARAIAIAVGKGVKFNQSGILRMHDFITEGSPALRNEKGFRIGDLQEEMESHLSSLIASLSMRSTDPRKTVIKIDESMPAHSHRNGTRMVLQQYSTPFPIGRVAVETLLPQPGESLLEPTIGNAVLVSGFLGRDITITGVELDQSRSARAQSIVNGSDGNVIEGDFLKVGKKLTEKFDLIVANPPFGRLDKMIIGQDVFKRSVRLRTLHHQIVFEALRHRSDNGRAFFVLPGDRVNRGEITGADRFFDNWLRATYHVAGSAAVDGRLYRKMGTEYPVIIYAVGPKRDIALSAAEIEPLAPKSHEIILSHDQLFAWSDRIQEKMRGLTNLSFIDYSDILRAEVSEKQSDKPTVSDDIGKQSPGLRSPSPKDAPASAATSTKPAVPDDIEEQSPALKSSPPLEIPTSGAVSASNETESDTSLPKSTVLVDDLDDDPFVRRYESFSALGEAQTQIQKSLQGLTYQALLDVERKHGSVDDYVAEKFGFNRDELSDRFSPEQIDALALNFARQEEGKGFLNADLTGVGKGRFLAGTMYAALKEDRPVIFMTEKPNLFSDMLARDMVNVMKTNVDGLKDIIKPFIFNSVTEAQVRNLETNELIYNTGNIAKDRVIPVGFNCVLSTYSQFQVASGSWKLDALFEWISQNAKMGRKPHLVLDEVHRAAGETSEVGIRIEALVSRISEVGGTVTFSSATPLKSGRNIRIYSPILPELGMGTSALVELIEKNPLALQEVLSSEMARMGTLISREVESRGTVRRFIPLVDIDPDRYERIVAATDMASGLLREIVNVAGDVKSKAKELAGVYSSSNPEERVGVTTTSPVTQFHSYCQYLLVAVKTAYARDLIVSAIAQGKKPVLVVENTGKELLARHVSREGGFGQIDRLPDIGDLLFEYADKILNVKITDSFGVDDDLRIEEYEGWLREFREKIEVARERGLSELTIAPLDYLQQIGNDLELKFGELTRRQLRAEKQENGTYQVESWTPEDKRKVIRDFNNGDIDFIGMNSSAASGVSMHPSPDTGDDLRPRVMIKLQLQSDVTQERQIDGRINRYGQVHDAEYWFPMSGFAADDRLVQLFNRKNRSLSATSSASRENSSNIEEVTDLLNPVGEIVVKEYLEEHRELADILGIGINPDDVLIDSYARRLIGRLVMLPVQQSNMIMSDLDTAFRMKVEVLDAQGQNPLRLRQFDWKAKIDVVSVLKPGKDGADAIGMRPVNLVRLTYKEPLEAIKSTQVNSYVQMGVVIAAEKGNGRALSGRELFGKIFDEKGVPDFYSPLFDKAMGRRAEERSLGKEEITAEMALSVWESRHTLDINKAKAWQKTLLKAFDAAEFLDAQLDYLIPGYVLGVKQEYYPHLFYMSTFVAAVQSEGQEFPRDMLAVLARISYDENDPLSLAKWRIGIAVPGLRYLEDVTLSSAFAVYSSFVKTEGREKKGFSPVIWKRAFDTDALTLLSKTCNVVPPDEHGKENDPYYNNPVWRNYMDKLFDEAPSGDVIRERYALEGNMFLSMHITHSTGDKLGQKAIYTSETGEIRHAVILKQGIKLTDLVDEVKIRLGSEAVISPFQNDRNLPAACKAYVSLMGVVESVPYQREGKIDTESVSYGCLVRSLTELFSEGNKEDRKIRDYIIANMRKIVDDTCKGMESSYFPELFVGGVDVFNDKDIYKTKVDPCGDRYYIFHSMDIKKFLSAASNIPVGEVHLFVENNTSALLFNKKTSDLVENARKCGVEDILDHSGNTFLTKKGKLTKGTLCYSNVEEDKSISGIEKLARTIQAFAETKKEIIQLRGSIASVFKSFEYFSGQAKEATHEKLLNSEISMENEAYNSIS